MKQIKIPLEVKDLLPSDFSTDAMHVMDKMDPIGPVVECEPYVVDGEYIGPQWTLSYMMGDHLSTFKFVAPFRYVRDLVEHDPQLSSLFAQAMGIGGASIPRGGVALKYEGQKWREKLAEEKANATTA